MTFDMTRRLVLGALPALAFAGVAGRAVSLTWRPPAAPSEFPKLNVEGSNPLSRSPIRL